MKNRFNISFENNNAQQAQEISGAVIEVVVNDDPSTSVQDPKLPEAEVTKPLEIEALIESEKQTNTPEFDDPIVAAMEMMTALEELHNEIISEIADNDRIIEITDGLQDVSTIVENTPAGQSVDLPMLQTAANMAVAGTDSDAASIIPSMESFKDKQLAMEEIGEKIKNALASVVESIKNIAGKFGNYVKNLFNVIRRLEQGIDERLGKLNAVKGNAKEVSFEVSTGSYLQKNQNDFVVDSADYIKSLNQSIDFYKSWTAAVVPSVAAFDGSVSEYMRTIFSSKGTKDASKRLYESYIATFSQGLKNIPGVIKTESSKDSETYESPELLGGVKMVAKLPKNIADFDKDFGNIRRTVAETSLSFDKQYMFHDKQSRKVEFKMTPSDIEKVLKAAKTNINTVKAYLDKSYKAFRFQALIQGVKINTPLTPVHTTIVNRGINHALTHVSFSRTYGERLTKSAMVVADKGIAALAKK